MQHFSYQAVDRDGLTIRAGIDADDVQQAVSKLQEQGLTLQSISLTSKQPPTGKRPQSSTAANHVEVSSPEQQALRSHVSVILERGKIFTPALCACIDELPPSTRRRQLLEICNVVERGKPDEAVAALIELPEYWIPLLAATANSRTAGDSLQDFLSEVRLTEEVRHKWWLVLAYPFILAAVTLAILTLLSIFIIPAFKSIFAEFDLQLPWLTKAVLDTSVILSKWGAWVLGALGIVPILIFLRANRVLPASIVSRAFEKLPFPLRRRTSLARLSRFTADLLTSGEDLPKAIRIAAYTATQPKVKHVSWELANDLESTGCFSQTKYQGPLSASITQALSSNVSSTARPHLLRTISSSHEDQIRSSLNWRTGLIEPIAICLIGGAVALTVLGLFIPLMKLCEGLTK